MDITNSIVAVADTTTTDTTATLNDLAKPVDLDSLSLTKIASSFYLASVQVHIWTATVKDIQVQSEIARTSGAEAKVVEVTKKLMKGIEEYTAITSLATASRARLKEIGTPWMRGWIALPNASGSGFLTEFNDRKAEFYRRVEHFLADYDKAITASAFSQQTLFKREDFPSVEFLRRKFSFDFTLMPMTVVEGHPILEVEKTLRNELGEYFNNEIRKRVQTAVGGIWRKLYNEISTVVAKLTDEFKDDGKEVKRRFHDSFLPKLESLVDLLRACNMTDDPKLDQAARDLDRVIRGIDVADLKKDKTARADTREKLQSILDKYNLTADDSDDDAAGW